MRKHTNNYCNQWQEYEHLAFTSGTDYYLCEWVSWRENEDWYYFLEMYDLYCFWCYRPEEKTLQSIDLYDLLHILSSKLFTQISLEIQDLTDTKFIDTLFLY